MTNYIDRQAAIDAIERLILPQTKGETAAEEINRVAWRCAINCAEEVIGHMPSAEVECKTGEWIEDAKTYYEQLNERGLGVDEYTPYFVDDIACSVCLAKYSMLDNETQFFKYCPNCGAKMESKDEQL